MDGVEEKPDSSEREDEEEDIERRTRCRLLGGGVGPAGVVGSAGVLLSSHRDLTIEPEKPSLMLRDELQRKALRIASLLLSVSSVVVATALPTAFDSMRRAKSSNPQSPVNDMPG